MAKCLDAMYSFCHCQSEREDDLPAMSVQTLQEVVFARKNPVSALLGSHTDVSPLIFQTALTAFSASSPTREDLRLFYAAAIEPALFRKDSRICHRLTNLQMHLSHPLQEELDLLVRQTEQKSSQTNSHSLTVSQSYSIGNTN